MAETLKAIIKLGMTIGVIAITLLLERYIEKLYLQSDIYNSFFSHGLFYLIVAVILTIIFWKLEAKKVKSTVLKIVFTVVIFVFSFYESSTILLWVNSLKQKDVTYQEYQVKIAGVAWGEIGIKNTQTGAYDEIKSTLTDSYVENEKAKIHFMVGIVGFRYSPTLEVK